MVNPTKWALQLKNIYYDTNPQCPNCGGRITASVWHYDDKFGSIWIKCSNCKEEIHFSRVEIPEKISKNITEIKNDPA